MPYRRESFWRGSVLLVTDCDVRRHDQRAMDTQPGVSRGAVTLRAASLRRGPAAPVCAVVSSDATASGTCCARSERGFRCPCPKRPSRRLTGRRRRDHVAANDFKRRDLPDVHHRAEARVEAQAGQLAELVAADDCTGYGAAFSASATAHGCWIAWPVQAGCRLDSGPCSARPYRLFQEFRSAELREMHQPGCGTSCPDDPVESS